MGSDTPPPFDLIGARYDESFVDRAAQLAEGDWIISRLSPGAKVLDVGCGSGTPTARQLAGAGLSVVGVDESAAMLALAAGRVPEAAFVHQDMREIGPALGEFDAATAFFSLLMLSRAEIPVVLRAIHARLRTGAPFALAMVLGDLDAAPLSFLDVPVKLTAYPEAELAGVVDAAGFRVSACRQVEVAIGPDYRETQLYLRATAC